MPTNAPSSSGDKTWIVPAAVLGVAAAVAAGARYRVLPWLGKYRSWVVGIIPARFASSRFPGKPLVRILGKPMIQTDEKIAECCRGFGADVIMTSEECKNGTECCYEALQKLGENYDIVVNIQGDEPLIEPEIIDGVVKSLQSFDSNFLRIYLSLPPTPLQLEEDLEQLKVLENGYRMKVIKVNHDAHGVDSPEDVDKIEALMRERNIS